MSPANSNALTQKDHLRIVRLLLDGKEPKDVAFLEELSVDAVYKVRDRYMVCKWVLKRHPKETFKLES